MILYTEYYNCGYSCLLLVMPRGRKEKDTSNKDKEPRSRESKPKSTYTSWILQAIAKVKGQKQRPSEDRISHVLQTQYGLKKDEISEQLRLCVKNGKVLRVTFKGQSSYKDPAMSSHSPRIAVEKGNDYRSIVKEALDNILDDRGATLKGIENYIKDRHSSSIHSDSTLVSLIKTALDKLQTADKVVKEGTHYRMAEPAPKVLII